MDEWAATGKARKYALVERERRFILRAAPSARPVRTVQIVDRYLDRCRIRLRSAATIDGEGAGSVVYKLTQKVPAAGAQPALITTFYLGPEEHRLFDTLPGAVLAKTRLSIPPLGVDVFEGALSGLVLAEAEFESDDEMDGFAVPAWAGPEVTHDPAFRGGDLVRATRSAIRRALARYDIPLPTSRTAG